MVETIFASSHVEWTHSLDEGQNSAHVCNRLALKNVLIVVTFPSLQRSPQRMEVKKKIAKSCFMYVCQSLSLQVCREVLSENSRSILWYSQTSHLKWFQIAYLLRSVNGNNEEQYQQNNMQVRSLLLKIRPRFSFCMKNPKGKRIGCRDICKWSYSVKGWTKVSLAAPSAIKFLESGMGEEQ